MMDIAYCHSSVNKLYFLLHLAVHFKCLKSAFFPRDLGSSLILHGSNFLCGDSGRSLCFSEKRGEGYNYVADTENIFCGTSFKSCWIFVIPQIQIKQYFMTPQRVSVFMCSYIQVYVHSDSHA